MPNKAKLVLREITTTTVTEDELKSSPLTFQQIDSNFINLRDQTIGIAGDDSTTVNLSAGNTIKIAGAGTVTTAVSGDTLTITGTGGGTAQGITVVGDDSTGTLISDGETIKIAGIQNIATAVSGDTLTITGPDLSSYLTDVTINIVADDSATISINNGGTLLFNGEQGITTGTNSDGSVTITGPDLSSYATQSYVTSQGYITNSPITVVGDDSTGTTLNTGETIKFAGTQNITTAVSGDTLTITGPDLSSYITNSTITIVGDDSTGVTLNSNETVKIAGTQNITTAVSGDTVTITGPNLTSFITASSTDTFTNKSISLSTNTITGTLAEFNTALSDDNFVSLTGAETLTNKTLTTPVIASITNTGTLTLPTSTDTLVGRATTDTLTNKTFDANGTGNSITNIEVADLAAGVLDTDLVSVSASDDTLPSAKAVKAYIDAQNTAQAITFVGDDSTGTAVNSGETFKIAGTQNIATAVSGDTLTITGPDLSSYLTNSTISVVGDDSTGTTLNSGETIKIAGTQNITTAVSGDTLTITGPDLSPYATTSYVDSQISATNTLTIADDTSTTGSIDLDNTLQVLGGNNITTSISGGTLTISGDKSIDVNEINSGDSSAIQINDAVNVSGTLNAKTIVTNDLISEDSTAIQVLDGLGVSGDLSVTGDITTADSLQFDTTAGEAAATGKLYYNSDYGTLAHGLGDGSEIIDGVDLVAYVTNAEATTLLKGEVVYIFGATGDRPSVKRADNSGDPTSSKTLGIVKNNITAGSAGYVKTQGIVTGLNTSTFTAGDILWLGTSGAFTATKPLHPAHLVFIGVVLRANAGNGLVYVKPQNGYELDELHDVDVSTAVANDILKYDGSAWFNVPGGELIYNGNSITAASNADIDLTAGGTGNINLNADTIRLGDAGANVVVTVNGAGNLDIYHELNATNFPQTPSSGNSNWAGYDSPTYVGTRTLYSNLTQGNITEPTERVRANTRFTVIKHPNDSTTYNDNDYVIQNTDFTIVDINGQNFALTSRGAGARGEANNCVLINTAGGTKTGPNIAGGSAFVEIDSGHGGDLTSANVMGFRSFLSNRANTGEFTRITNAYGYVAEGLGTGGTGANGTNRFVTNEFGYFSQGATGTSLVTNYYGFYSNTGANATNKYAFYSADDAYLSRLGTIERAREKQNALTSSSTITVNADLAPVHKVTLGVNTQIGITGLSTGQTVTIIIVQDGTGNRTATFTSDTSTAVKFAAGSATLSTAANAIDVVRIYNDGTNFLGILDKGFA